MTYIGLGGKTNASCTATALPRTDQAKVYYIAGRFGRNQEVWAFKILATDSEDR